MRWYSYIIIAGLFYVLVLLQNSFFAQFSLWGATPNLVFSLFILLCFFAREDQVLSIIFYAFIAGLLLDIFSLSLIGVSVVLFLVIGLSIKKFQTLLLESRTQSTFLYFFSVFLFSFLTYKIVLSAYYYFSGSAIDILNLKFMGELVYTSFSAVIFLFIYSRFFAFRFDNRQLSLFNRK